jgi:hypothetical protein
MNVAATCRDLRLSRKSFYKYVARFQAIGVAGFYPESRRPRHSPSRLTTELEDVLVKLRKQEAEAGWDYGADAVLMRLEEQRDELWPADRPLPARSTINRVFDDRGLLTTTPKRRPRRPPRRFAREEANALWQFDGFEHKLLDGTKAVILHLSDDCSRLDLALQLTRSENGADVWTTFCLAVERYGLPVEVLTDNGGAFSGRRRGWISDFEHRLADLGIKSTTCRVRHPQTCGKNERAHQRVQKWLARQPRDPDAPALQARLDSYREAFNHRRNMVLAKLTPQQRFDLGPRATPGDIEELTTITRHTVSATGAIGMDGMLIGLGRTHAGQPATAFRTGDHVAIFINDRFTRELILDRTRRYQPQDR